MKISFVIEGSRGNTYLVSFWKEGNKLLSSCTCPAGRKIKSLCKHRISILDGDVTNVLEDDLGKLELLSETIKGTEAEVVLNNIQEALLSEELLKVKFKLTPNKRRKKIDIDVSSMTLIGGGIIKGGTGQYLDVYDCDNYYVGSVKTSREDFESNINQFLDNSNVRNVLISDNPSNKRNKNIYYFLDGGNFSIAYDSFKSLDDYKDRLKYILTDY